MNNVKVSVIIPVFNGEQWIEDCISSIEKQDVQKTTHVEICVYNDGSTDGSMALLLKMQKQVELRRENFSMVVIDGPHPPKGVGFGKNRAVEASSGQFLCFQDIDDVMAPNRISLQLECAAANQNALVGSQFTREPADSTHRYTKWANQLPQHLLTVQVLTSHGPTVIMPTWFCHRDLYHRVGGFSEAGAGTPEDLLFFYKLLDLPGDVMRVDHPLVVYRFHPQATTFSILENTIWDIRVRRLEERVLPGWQNWTIWNAGKQGRKLWRSLSSHNRAKVIGFCDVDVNKIGKTYRPYSPSKRTSQPEIPIRHFRDCRPPFVICVKMDLTGGHFEANLRSLELQEGRDYVLFS